MFDQFFAPLEDRIQQASERVRKVDKVPSLSGAPAAPPPARRASRDDRPVEAPDGLGEWRLGRLLLHRKL